MIFKFRSRKKPKPTVLALLAKTLLDRNGFGVVPSQTPCVGGTAWADVEILSLNAAMNIARETNLEVDVGQGCLRTLSSPSILEAPGEGGVSENDRITSHRLGAHTGGGTDRFARILSAIRRALRTPFSCTQVSPDQIEVWTADPTKNVWNRSRLAVLEALGDLFAIRFDFQRSRIIIRALNTESQPVRQLNELA